MESRLFDATENGLGEVRDFIAHWAHANGIPASVVNKIAVCADEIGSNIVQYSSARSMEVRCEIQGSSATISFVDDGREFNPLENVPEPDVSLSLEDRKIGGLGIFLVKKMANSCAYENASGKNVLKMTFTF